MNMNKPPDETLKQGRNRSWLLVKFTFGGIIYESVLGKGIISLLILSGVNLISTIPALFLIDRLSRRKLLIFLFVW